MSKFWGNVSWEDISENNDKMHEASLLKLNCDKALSDLNWSSALEFSDTVRITISWYKTYYEKNNKQSMYEYAINQISEYVSLAKTKGISWSI